MKKQNKVIAVDLGASGGKVFACSFSEETFTMQEIHRFNHEAVAFHLPNKAGVMEERLFWDDVYLYGNIVAGLHAYRREIGTVVDSIGIDTWGTDGMFMAPGGLPVERMYSYRDHRLDGMIDKVKAKIDAKRMYSVTGITFQPFNLSNQLSWFVENRKELLKKGVIFLPAPTLFGYYLGGAVQVDSTWASVSQLMDARRKKWSREFVRALGIPSWVLPEIVPPGTVIGKMSKAVAESVGLNQAKIIAVASHDTASAFAAAPVRSAGSALIISSGTWSLIGKLVRRPITSEEAFKAGLSNEGGIGNVRFLKNCMGTWIVQELRRSWKNRDGVAMEWEELNRITEEGKRFSAFIDPDDPGFYNPQDMEKAVADFLRRTGQDAPKDRGTLLRMVYESLAMKYRMVSEEISNISGKATKVAHIVGGGSRNQLLNQMAADSLGVRVVAGPEEATAVGNAMVQALGLGVIDSMDGALPLIRGAFPIKEFRPKDAQSWAKEYKRFVGIVKAGKARA